MSARAKSEFNKSSKRPKPRISKKDYKKPLTKRQILTERRERAFSKYNKMKANCGEDTIDLSFQAYIANFEQFHCQLERQQWHGIRYMLEEQSLWLNGHRFIPAPPDKDKGKRKGMDDWQYSPINFKYYCGGYKLGFSGGNREFCPRPTTQANVYMKLGYQALMDGLPKANQIIKDLIASFANEIWWSRITRLDAHIDVPMPYSIFHSYRQNESYRGRLRKKTIDYGSTTLDDRVVIMADDEGMLINKGGIIEIAIYDKLAELNSDTKKHDAYVSKYGDPPEYLTRIEFRFRRDFFRSRGLGVDHSIDNLDDWLKARISIIKHVMTEQFRFVDKDGNTAPEWEWALEQFIKWATAENERSGINEQPIQRIQSKTKMTGVQKFTRYLGGLRTAMTYLLGRSINDKHEFYYGLREIFRDFDEFNTPAFTQDFFNKGNAIHLKYVAENDIVAIVPQQERAIPMHTPATPNSVALDSQLGCPPRCEEWGVFDWLEWHANNGNKSA